MTYSGTGPGTGWRARVYPDYLRSASRSKAQVYRCGLSLAGLAHLIEDVEYEIFQRTHAGESRKEFRVNYPAERAGIVTDIQNAWQIVKSLATAVKLVIDETTTDEALGRLQTASLDGYDLFIVQAMIAAGTTQILTDDGDYCTVPGIQVFTTNRRVIDAAQAQGKLFVR